MANLARRSTTTLTEEATIGIFPIVRQEGSRQVARQIQHYNLDAIISVGYRVNSIRATQFRQWATGFIQDASYQSYFDKFAAKALEASSHREDTK